MNQLDGVKGREREKRGRKVEDQVVPESRNLAATGTRAKSAAERQAGGGRGEKKMKKRSD